MICDWWWWMDERLPDFLQEYFWDTDFAQISWDLRRDFIMRRVLQVGSWEAVCWLRGELGDEALGVWIEAHEGGGLSPRQLRYWGLVLNLPEDEVTGWVVKEQESVWGRRIER
jgi:hypothetical protein